MLQQLQIRMCHNLLITFQLFPQTQECRIPTNKTTSKELQEIFLLLIAKQVQNPFLSASHDEQTKQNQWTIIRTFHQETLNFIKLRMIDLFVY